MWNAGAPRDISGMLRKERYVECLGEDGYM